MARSYCIICGKPPDQGTDCPSCKTRNICRYHIYKVFSDRDDSPQGCPKCGPRCTMCGVQTPLQHYKDRAVCTSCKVALSSSEIFKKERQRLIAVQIQALLTTLLTFLGLGLGIYLGLQPSFQKIVIHFTKVKIPGFVIVTFWGTLGLIVGSLCSTILNTVIKFDR